MMRLLAAIVFLSLATLGIARAHELRPAYLSMTETSSGAYAVVWKVPALADRRLALFVRLPESAAETTERQGAFLTDAYVERWTVLASAGLSGETIAIEGLSESPTDVLVRIERLSGETMTARLTSATPSLEVPAAMGLAQVAGAYLGLGVEHILFGVDHLIFVLALILLVRGWKRILLTVTAFTVAHSLTLGAATLGYIHIPGPPVEAAIALSIVLVAVEIVNVSNGRDSLSARLPWLIAFAFGLLHGLGFAGALSEVGLPGHAIPVALLFFNVGVELGQLLFVAAVMATFTILRPLWSRVVGTSTGWSNSLPTAAAAYCIGGVASFWLIERIHGFWVA